jgi:hypothetical protein
MCFASHFVLRREAQSILEFFHGLIELLERNIGTRQVVVGVMMIIVVLGTGGVEEPRDRFLVSRFLDQIGANVVVRITEIRRSS